PDAPLNPNQPFYPFRDRHAFDWARFHFVELQASAANIRTGLDLWLANTIATTGDPNANIPWRCAKDLYATIDNIQQGSAPFETTTFKYTGELPENPPAWMTEEYELCVRDAREALRHQLSTTEFVNQFETRPYRQFEAHGMQQRVWTNLMSGDWAWEEVDTITDQVEGSEGAMLVPIVSGLDKTTVSVATGHQEYHPFYISAGNLTNTARRSHGAGVIPVAFLPIPKTVGKEAKTLAYQVFVQQMYHACIARIFAPLRPYMTSPDIVRCPDGHLRKAIYSIGPVIANYPEQVWLSCIVQQWCPKCMAKPDDLDNPGAHQRTHEKTDVLIECFDPGILWKSYGVRADVVPFTHEFPRADIHKLMAPDLLHQVIKGTFKDHLVQWVMDYLVKTQGAPVATQIIADIDRRYFGDTEGIRESAKDHSVDQSQIDDVSPWHGPRLTAFVQMGLTHGMFCLCPRCLQVSGLNAILVTKYPSSLDDLSHHRLVREPRLKAALLEYLFSLHHPDQPISPNISDKVAFTGKIRVYHSASAHFYAPSDACGDGGMQRQVIRSNPNWKGRPRYDTIFVTHDGPSAICGMKVAQVRLFFTYTDMETGEAHPCALVDWFSTVGDKPDPITGMWVVERNTQYSDRQLSVISLRSIVRGAHLVPVYGNGVLPELFSFTTSLEAFKRYFVNPYVDHHTHELL
ncbi:hypothetical protein FA15DRAFT_553625, partial [Coprinopsis marcescibilis]